MRRRNTKNELNLGLVREINQTLDENSMLSGLTICPRRPNLLFSSSIFDSTSRTTGFNLYKYNKHLVCLQGDSKDGLSLQVLSEKVEENLEFCGFKETHCRTDKEIFDEEFLPRLMTECKKVGDRKDSSGMLVEEPGQSPTNPDPKSNYILTRNESRVQKQISERRHSVKGFSTTDRPLQTLSPSKDKSQPQPEAPLLDSQSHSINQEIYSENGLSEVTAGLSDLTGETQEAESGYIDQYNLRRLSKILLEDESEPFIEKFCKLGTVGKTGRELMEVLCKAGEKNSGFDGKGYGCGWDYFGRSQAGGGGFGFGRSYGLRSGEWDGARGRKKKRTFLVDKQTKAEFKALCNKEMVITKRCFNSLMTRWDLE